MHLILIPGLWLDASSWDDVVPALQQAGHRIRPLTLPGMAGPDDDRRGIGLRDHVDAVIAAIDATAEPVVLVGHSAGGAIAHAAVDARPDRVARVVYVGSEPLGDGHTVNDGLPVVAGEVPLPEWSVFDDVDIADLDDAQRASFRARAVPAPAGVSPAIPSACTIPGATTYRSPSWPASTPARSCRSGWPGRSRRRRNWAGCRT